MATPQSRVEAIRERNRRRKKVRRIIFLALFLGVVVGAIFFFRAPNFLLKEIVIDGAHVLDKAELKAAIDEELSGYYAFVIPKRSMFFFPKEKIEYRLRDDFRRIETLSLDENRRALHVTLTERSSVYLWCGEEPRQNPEPCYFIDDAGYVFSKAPFFSGSIYFKFFGKLEAEGEEGALGGRVLPETYMPNIIAMKEGLEKSNLTPYAFVRLQEGDAAFLLSESYRNDMQRILFKNGDDTHILVRNIRAAAGTSPLKDELKSSFDSLLYLDARYPEKVYYKFIEETKESE